MLSCPRLDHFVRFNPNGSVSRCGHMIDPPQFNSLAEMDASRWLAEIKRSMAYRMPPLSRNRNNKQYQYQNKCS